MSTNDTQKRRITDHRLNGLNEAIEIHAIDRPGPGGANHVYTLDVVGGAPASGGMVTTISFQKGSIGEAGFNGLSIEAIVAIAIDRLRGFQHPNVYRAEGDPHFDLNQRGQYACRENAMALTHFEEGLMWLQKRTRDRMARGVEGTSAK